MPNRPSIDEEQLPDLPNESTDEPILITENDQSAIALMSYDRLTSLLDTVDILSDQELANTLEQSLLELETGETILQSEL
ncbi:hypothetical protein IQ250_06095 [Pseudanabaenaceae cyanobacterium LEGE 13415]|nr:hypothetical protein [Pseudanabaenaceae cyanobacterium LEGE 13415]